MSFSEIVQSVHALRIQLHAPLLLDQIALARTILCEVRRRGVRVLRAVRVRLPVRAGSVRLCCGDTGKDVCCEVRIRMRQRAP